MRRLVRSEVHRLTARRFVRGLVVLYLLVIVVTTSVQYATHGTDVAGAQQRARVEGLAQYREEKAAFEAAMRRGEVPERATFPPYDEAQWTRQAFRDPRWNFARQMPEYAKGFGVYFALAAFLVGATAGGAEWAARTLPALLFWEPRRLRVLLVKGAVLAVFVAAVAVVGQVLLTAGAFAVASTHGTTAGADGDLWRSLTGAQARGVLLAVLAALTAFGLANLTRNTGAALGAGFVYLAILESLLRSWRPRLGLVTIGTNAAAVVQGRLRLPVDDETVLLTSTRGALTLGLYVVLLLGLATALFVRRDVT